MFRRALLTFALSLAASIAGMADARAQQVPPWDSPAAYNFFARHRLGATEERRLSSGADAQALDRYLSAINRYLGARDAKAPGAQNAYAELLGTANALLSMPPQAYPDQGGSPARPLSFRFTPDGSRAVLQAGAWSASMDGEQLRGFFEGYTRALATPLTGPRGPFALGSFPSVDRGTRTSTSLRYKGENRLPWLHLRGGRGADLHLTTLNTFRLIEQMNATTQLAAARARAQGAPDPVQVQVAPQGPSTTEKVMDVLMILAAAGNRVANSQRDWQARFGQPIASTQSSGTVQVRPTGYGRFGDSSGNSYQTNGTRIYHPDGSVERTVGKRMTSSDGQVYNLRADGRYHPVPQ